MATRKHPYLVAANPVTGSLVDLFWDTNGATAPTVFSANLNASTPVVRLNDSDGTPFYRLLYRENNLRPSQLARLHAVQPSVSGLNGDNLEPRHITDLDPGSDPVDTTRELDLYVIDSTESLQAILDAWFLSLLTQQRDALDSAINAGEAAVVATDGGAAAFAAARVDQDTLVPATVAATASAAAVAAQTGATDPAALTLAFNAGGTDIIEGVNDDRLVTAWNDAVAAVVGNDGGAAGLTAWQTQWNNYNAAAEATAAAASAIAADNSLNLEAAIDAGLLSAFGALETAIDTAVAAAIAAVVATDGGAAALAAFEVSIDTFNPATTATTAAAAAIAAAPSLLITNGIASGRRIFMRVLHEISPSAP